MCVLALSHQLTHTRFSFANIKYLKAVPQYNTSIKLGDSQETDLFFIERKKESKNQSNRGQDFSGNCQPPQNLDTTFPMMHLNSVLLTPFIVPHGTYFGKTLYSCQLQNTNTSFICSMNDTYAVFRFKRSCCKSRSHSLSLC